ncbi:DUF5020 family protein [Gaoshiqia sediminis]|uniref:DUF5020 family protein n=1 Tax=Gaoshiqia sediminis TaxID=2986998 RepID=A0AA41Y477_9BACT|nr:DUF5020 family protein [Gaoshiqia sediminis]MCW0481530.1 DUF5020 family protein [Gaoshiqia sediminis]
MKKVLLILFAAVLSLGAFAQNVQTHYDLGKDRSYLTTTVEMFRPDKMGSTFFFIDMDYGVGDVEGVSLAYWEIARAFKLGKSPLAAHIEYNGGFGQWKAGAAGGAYQINDAWLGGLEYSWNAEDFSRGFTLQAMYKNIRGVENASFQLTGVWYVNFLKGKMSFTGFADFWKEETAYGDFIFLSEPQLWYNICDHFSVGGEVEISNNFGGMEGFNVMPTLAAKWTF